MQFLHPLPDITVLADQTDIPGIGHLPVNAFVLSAVELTLLRAPQADPFVGPDQRALEELLASFEPVLAG